MKAFVAVLLVAFVAVVESRPGLLGNLANGAATAVSQARKWGDGAAEFFGQGAKEVGNAAVNAVEDAGKGLANTAGAVLGDKNLGKNVSAMIGRVGHGVKNLGDNVANAGERAATGLAGEAGQLTDNVTNGVDGQNHKVGSSYYSAFSG